uniref:phenylalanine--tRNA ligase n=1 Tax=Leiomenia cribrosa TaxID=217483 RepID=A0A4D6WW26_9FLOR|nr:Phenylalanine-tRNA ligase beta subunit [Leiomenia cribrosa]
MAGFEIETIIDQPQIQDKTIDINITANRSDSTCIVGLAREISSILNCKLLNNNIYQEKYLNQNICTPIYNLPKNNIISDSIIDIRYNTINNLKQKTSPLWLKKRLQGCGIKPQNIVNDLVNYINIKWGQNIEAFDLDKIAKNTLQDKKSNQLEFEELNTKEKILELLGFHNSYLLSNVSILKYNNQALSILGIESNYNFYCDTTTSSIIIINKIYKPAYIHNIISKNNVKTEISTKHLKGIIRTDFLNAYEEIINLFVNLNPESILGPITQYSEKPYIKEKTINIHENEIYNILGKTKSINQEEIINILTSLNFKPQYKNCIFSLRIPEYRDRDINRPIDIIEEISRIHGFQKFVDKIPKNNKQGKISNTIILIKKIRYILKNIGLHEVINYSLEKPYKYQLFNYNKNILLYNPLLEEQSQLRDSLIPNIINVIKYNKKNQNLAFECFEIGKIFNRNNNEQINMVLTIGNPSYSRSIWSEKNKSMNWFQAKGILEDFFEKLQVNIEWHKLENTQNKFIYNQDLKKISHPHRKAILLNSINQKKIGIFFQLNTKLKHELNIDYELYVCEINIYNLIQSIVYKNHLDFNFINYSNYPSVKRDISLALTKDESAYEIKKYILSKKNPLIESVEIFNEYIKTNISQIKNNRLTGFRITYRSNTRTLNDQDIKNIDLEINNLLHR